MYDNEYRLSEKAMRKNRAFTESLIKMHENSAETEDDIPIHSEKDNITKKKIQIENAQSRYCSFVESVKTSLVTEAVYKIFENSVSGNITTSDRSIMRSIVSEYVHETGYDNILFKMKTGSVILSEIYNIITESSKKILESVDKNDPNTFEVTKDMKDDFYKALDYTNSDDISNAIKDRVSTAMDDFVTSNTKDHEDITSTLQQAQDKISKISEDETEMREGYNMIAKQKICKIRSGKKNVLHSMISAMCENVLKHQSEYGEFLNEGKLNIDKIVKRTSLMYTFIETLNTSKIDTINESFIQDTIEGLKG